MSAASNLNEYATAEHALKYLALADRVPHRAEGEAVLLEFVPKTVRRILDLGTAMRMEPTESATKRHNKSQKLFLCVLAPFRGANPLYESPPTVHQPRHP